MHCTKFFYQIKVVTNRNLQLLSYVTFFDVLHHYGVIVASQICSVSRKYWAVLRNRFFQTRKSFSYSRGNPNEEKRAYGKEIHRKGGSYSVTSSFY